MSSASRGSLEPQTPIGDYQVVRLLGIGNMGAVYEGVHALLHKRVAIKVMHGELAKRADLVERFLREGRAAVAIQHPNVVQVAHVGFHKELPYLVMDFLEGSDLRAALAERGRFPAGEACDLILPVIAGVAAAHESGVTHRDLKPENVFLVRPGRRERVAVIPKVVDFGIAKLDDGHKTTTQTIMGSPAYMSPEQCNGRTGPTSDQWALGVMLYEVCCGALPFEADSQMALMYRICYHPPSPAADLGVRLPPVLDTVILRALQKDPADRFPSVRALGVALLPLCSPVVRDRYAHELLDAEPHAHVDHSDDLTQLAPQADSAVLGLSAAAPQDRDRRSPQVHQVAPTPASPWRVETPPPEPPPARPTDTLTPASHETSPPQGRSRRLVLTSAGVAVGAVVLMLTFRLSGPSRSPTATPVSAPMKERTGAEAPKGVEPTQAAASAKTEAPAKSAAQPAKTEPAMAPTKAAATFTKAVATQRTERRPGKPAAVKHPAPLGKNPTPAQPKAFFPDD